MSGLRQRHYKLYEPGGQRKPERHLISCKPSTTFIRYLKRNLKGQNKALFNTEMPTNHILFEDKHLKRLSFTPEE